MKISYRTDGPWRAILILPYIALVIPAALVLAGPLQSNGWIPRLLIFWIAAGVVLGWIARPKTPIPRRRSPAEIGCWIFLFGLLCSLCATEFRNLAAEESTGATRAALVMFPLVVVAIAVAATADERRCRLLLIGILAGATISAVIGIVQSFAPLDLAQVLRLPGMIARDNGGTGIRGDFRRVKGASAHPIEFGVLTGALVPLAIHFARFGRTKQARLASVVATLIFLLVIPLSISRSGVLAVGIAIAVYAVVMTARQRLSALVLAAAGILVMRAAIPGLLGTLGSLFSSVSTDPSISGRTEDYQQVYQLFENAPLLGSGLGTFRPEQYFFLDNQFLGSLVEGGLVLFLAMIAWMVLAVASGRGAVRRARDAEGASLAQAVISAILSICISGLFFDLFSFAQVTIVLFLLVGVAGSLWHQAMENGRSIGSPSERVGVFSRKKRRSIRTQLARNNSAASESSDDRPPVRPNDLEHQEGEVDGDQLGANSGLQDAHDQAVRSGR